MLTEILRFPCRVLSLTARGMRHHHNLSSATRQHIPPASALYMYSEQSPNTSDGLAGSLANLRLSESALSAHHHATAWQIHREYKLPTLLHSILHKKTILDPVTNPQSYDLPMHSSVVTEKLTPSFINIVPIKDPNPLQVGIDQWAPPITKHCMPYLVRIRHRKMKKHKLRKLRKKMIFLNRKLTEIKKRKKEKKLREYETMWADRGQAFNAESWVDERLSQARKGGFQIDIWQEYRMKSKNTGLEKTN